VGLWGMFWIGVKGELVLIILVIVLFEYVSYVGFYLFILTDVCFDVRLYTFLESDLGFISVYGSKKYFRIIPHLFIEFRNYDYNTYI
jgi:hypothetical protein